jgi:hypothetical protein
VSAPLKRSLKANAGVALRHAGPVL